MFVTSLFWLIIQESKVVNIESYKQHPPFLYDSNPFSITLTTNLKYCFVFQKYMCENVAVKEFCSSLAILKYRVVSECYFKYAQGNRNR